ncbi:MAG: TIGR02300 family protein [Rhodospirillaceae bacterium]
MAKTEWGIKRICPSCSARYYDFHKSPPVCPTCQSVYDPEALLKSRRARPVPADVTPKKIPLPVRESLGVDVDSETVALDQADDTVPVADIIDSVDVDVDAVADIDADEEEPEDVSELDDLGDDMDEVLTIQDDE